MQRTTDVNMGSSSSTFSLCNPSKLGYRSVEADTKVEITLTKYTGAPAPIRVANLPFLR